MTQKQQIQDLTKKLEKALKRIEELESKPQEVHYHYHYGTQTAPQMPAPLPDSVPHIPNTPQPIWYGDPIYCDHTGKPNQTPPAFTTSDRSDIPTFDVKITS